jgi:hypothetical protein
MFTFVCVRLVPDMLSNVSVCKHVRQPLGALSGAAEIMPVQQLPSDLADAVDARCDFYMSLARKADEGSHIYTRPWWASSQLQVGTQ